jgi:hypothetical protein
MRDSQRNPEAYPRRGNSRPMPDPASPRNSASNGQPRPSARRPGMARPDQTPQARPPLYSDDHPSKRPKLPSAQETREAQAERVERLRAMRQDFFDHAQTKMKPQKPRNVWLAVALTGVLLVFSVVGAVVLLQSRSTLFSDPAQTAATQLMSDMQQKNYTAAYADCATNVQEAFSDHSGALSQNDFTQQAQAADQLGPIINFTQTSSTSTDANNKQYTFSVTRSHQQPVNVTISVTKGSDGSWKVSSIDSALFPSPPPPPDNTTPTPTS